MSLSSLTHLDDEILRAYGLALLDNEVSGTVNRHLQSCDRCTRRMAALGKNDRANRPRDTKKATGLTPSDRAAATPGSPQSDRGWPAGLDGLPDHEIIRRLDSGGMGAVYLARHKLLKRLEALKVILPHLTHRPTVVERFHREIEAAGSLDHPNIVPAYAAMETASGLVLVMKYVEGQDLRQLVTGQGPLAVGVACGYALQAACGLQHAHDRRIVHRDVKPANLMLTMAGAIPTVMVLDFGLAKFVRELEEATDLTGSRQTLGTPDFIAPEQTRDPRAADIRADIYSLGCTLYFLLTGHPPFRASSVVGLYEAHRSKKARPLKLMRPDVPTELSRVVATMMAKNPARRYRSPAAVIEALAPFASEDSPSPDRDRTDSKLRPTPLIHTQKAPRTSSWPGRPGCLDGGRGISGLLTILERAGGPIRVGLVVVLLTVLAFALIHFNRGKTLDSQGESSPFPPPLASAGARVRVKSDTLGFRNAVTNSLEQSFPIDAGWTGVVTELPNPNDQSNRWKVLFDPPGRGDLWILSTTLEAE